MYGELKQIKTFLMSLATAGVSVYDWQTFSSSVLE